MKLKWYKLLAVNQKIVGSSPFTPTSIEIFVLDLWKVMWVETQISHYGCWAGMVTLRRSKKPENKVQFFEHPHNAPLMEW